MKNQQFYLLFFLMISVFGFGQTKEIDSVYIDSIFQGGEAIEYEEPKKALRVYREVYKLSYTRKYFGRAFHAKLYSALVHNNVGQYDSAFYYLDHAEKLAVILDNDLYKAKVVSNRANTFHLTGNAKKAIEHHLMGISYLEQIEDSVRLALTYNNVAAVYGQLKNNQKEIYYIKKSLLITPSSDTGNKSLSYGDLAVAYLKVDSLKVAKRNLIKSDSISKIGENPKILPFYIYRNWGEYYRIKKEYNTAIEYYKKCLEVAEDINYTHFSTDVLLYMGQSYQGLANFKPAEESYLKAIEIGKEFGFVEIQERAFGYLGALYNKYGESQKAYDNLKIHDILKDSLNLMEHAKQINQLETQFQSEKKDKEIAEQKLALTESKSKTRTMNILIVSLLLGSILLWFSFRQRQKRMQQQLVAIEREQEVKTLESLMEGEEKERLRIAKELHDGVNGDLAAIKFKLTSLLETNNQAINEAVAMIDTSSEQVRAISHNLVPPSLRDFNVIEAVATYCENMNAIHKPEITFQHVGDEIVLEKKQEANLFRIVQELVTNSIKHAEAKEIIVQLSNVQNNVQLTVEDYGKGFDVANVKSDGIGMQNVKSRVDYLGGLMDIKSDAKGTSFTITIDMKTT